MEGILLHNLFTELNLHQLITDPTHFFRDDCLPSCIDLILTDQPNLVTESGTRSSLDPTVKHDIIFCRANFKIPSPPTYQRKIWHYNRADTNLIRRTLSEFPWESQLDSIQNPNGQVSFLNEVLLNVMSNFVPNSTKKCRLNDPPWFNNAVRKILRKHNKLHKRYRLNNFSIPDKIKLDECRNLCSKTIENAKNSFLISQGNKLTDLKRAPKAYWKIVNRFMNKCKAPRIPPY